MEPLTVSNTPLWLAFVAGFLSFVSPCVLPMIPAYVAYLTGRAAMQTESAGTASNNVTMAGPNSGGAAAAVAVQPVNRLGLFFHGLAFVAGFTLVFVFFGLLTGAALQLLHINLRDVQDAIRIIGGVVVIIFALQFMGVIGWGLQTALTKIKWSETNPTAQTVRSGLEQLMVLLYRDTRSQMNPRNPHGYWGTTLMGISFAAGWTPCIGPIYGTILTAAWSVASSNLYAQVGSLLLAYSLGLGIPFLMATLAIDRLRGPMKRIQRHMRLVEVFTGVLMLFIGYMLLTNQFAALNQYASGLGEFSVKLEECTVKAIRGEMAWGEWGKCMNKSLYGDATSEQKQPLAAEVLTVLNDGRLLILH